MADNFRGLTTGATLGRELPFSQEAEEAVLGGVLRDPSVLPKVIEILKPESFYRPQHQHHFHNTKKIILSHCRRFKNTHCDGFINYRDKVAYKCC